MAKDDDEIILPKKSKTKSAPASSVSKGQVASPPMRRLMRITRFVGIAFGGFVALVGVMSLAGMVSSNFIFRVVVGLLVVVALPALLSDRMLKRTNANLGSRGALGMVGDVFAIVLLGVALMFVAAESVTKNVIAHEGDHYARANSTMMARVVYFIAGVSPVWAADKPPAKPAASASASASGAPK